MVEAPEAKPALGHGCPSAEEWRDVPGYEGRYRVSSLGRMTGVRGKIMNPSPDKDGYRRASLWRSGVERRVCAVHVLVAAAFIGPRPARHDVDHIDADRANNAVSNLRYISHAENVAHTVAAGRQARGETHTSSRLTAEQVLEIRSSYRKGERGSAAALAARYGVGHETVAHVVNGRTWKHLPLGAPSAVQAAPRHEGADQ